MYWLNSLFRNDLLKTVCWKEKSFWHNQLFIIVLLLQSSNLFSNKFYVNYHFNPYSPMLQKWINNFNRSCLRGNASYSVPRRVEGLPLLSLFSTDRSKQSSVLSYQTVDKSVISKERKQVIFDTTGRCRPNLS